MRNVVVQELKRVVGRHYDSVLNDDVTMEDVEPASSEPEIPHSKDQVDSRLPLTMDALTSILQILPDIDLKVYPFLGS